MMRTRWFWTMALALTPACLSGGGAGDGVGVEARQVAAALTERVDFAGGSLQDGDVPAATDSALTLAPLDTALILSPGQSSIMSLDIDHPDDETDPVVATLIQFGSAGKHIEVPTQQRMTVSQGRVQVDNSFSVGGDVCDGLCNKEFTLELTTTGKLQSGAIGKHATLSIRLDCREAGDPDACAGAAGPAGAAPSSAGGQRYRALSQRSLSALCPCVPDCAALMASGAQDGEIECIATAFDAAYTGANRAVLDCALDQMETQIECLERAGCDDTALAQCTDSLDDAALEAACGSVPTTFDDATAACTDDPAWTCDDGEEIFDSWVCDDFEDCTDGSDEAQCPSSAGGSDSGSDADPGVDTGGADTPSLGGLEYACNDGRTTVASAQLCDGVDDCPNVGGGLTEETYCIGGEFFCLDGGTVPPAAVCDGVDDCGDGFDESSCAPAS